MNLLRISKYYRRKLFYRALKLKPAKNCYITCAGKTDGPGAQIQAVYSTILFAHEMNIPFAHTPFQSIEHNYLSIHNDEWVKRWNDFINLQNTYPSIDSIENKSLNQVTVQSTTEIKKQSNTLYIIDQAHDFADHNQNRYSKYLNTFKNCYAKAHDKNTNHYDTKLINIAVHVRRGDVDAAGAYNNRFTDNKSLCALITQIKNELDAANKKYCIHVYSEAEDVNALEDFKGENVVLYDTFNPFEIFPRLVNADILVMAKSSFSYSAALLSDGIKIYQPFWHQPLDEWICVDEDFRIDAEQLKTACLSPFR